MNSFYDRLKDFMKSRLFIFFSSVTLLFFILTGRLFFLQVLHGDEYQQDLKTSIMRKLTIPASRGNIYDRYGRPLATNQVAFSVKIDDSIKTDLENENLMLYQLVEYLEQNGQPVKDLLPISENLTDYTFTDTLMTEDAFKKSIGIPSRQANNMSPSDVMEYLVEKFELPPEASMETKRKVISLGLALDDKNLMLLSLINLLEENGETLVDDLPISQNRPYAFQFDGNETKERTWKRDSLYLPDSKLSYTAEETIAYLSDYFDIPKELSDATTRKLIAVRYSLFLERYRKYQPVTVALGISSKTVAAIEELQTSFPGIQIDTDSLRYYPAGIYFSHMLGYIRRINDTDYETYKEYKTEDGSPLYSNTDIIGQSGIERAEELDLNGIDGEMMVEVDSHGRRINTIETKQPVSGKNVFLTIDKELQTAAYNYLEDALTEVLISKLTARTVTQSPISLKQLFSSMVNANSIPISGLLSATEGERLRLGDMIRSAYPGIELKTAEDLAAAKQVITNGIESGAITMQQMVLVLYEQGMITCDEEYLDRIKRGAITPLSVVIEKLRAREIHPSDTNLDPCTGSVVVTDVHTGEALALVSYPSYDNNEFVNHFNNDYFNMLNNDPTTPFVNRPLTERKAPGSTFKMVSAIAGLETGAITPTTQIRDMGQFTKTGIPYPKCWIYSNSGGTHGSIDVSTALEVSCNYFFYELAYRMGNVDEGTGINSITTLNEYMAAFGLNSPTGVEIGEKDPGMASPAYKEQIVKWNNPDATISQTRWTDGDTIRTAIGQSVNNYSAAHLAKYVATLANGGTRYRMHLIGKIEHANGTIFKEFLPEIENILEIQPQNLDAVFKGMLLVTQGTRGTLRTVFRDFPIDVAAKSGTAQENLQKSSHTVFVGFAPYDDPQISISIIIPFGEYSTSPAAVVAKNVIAEYMGLNYQPENSYMDNLLTK